MLACLLNLFWLTFWEPYIHAAEEMTRPTLNKGNKWRIGYYEGGSWQDYRESLKEGHVDMMFAMGTWAGQDLANNSHAIPTMVMSTTDPVQSGIVKSADDSGLDHVHARCDPTRRQRQIRLFHDIIKFKRIGVVYDDKDPNGKVMAHLNELEEIGLERRFDVVTCSAPDSQKSLQVAVDGYRACVRKLAPEVDAFYLSDLRGTEADMLFETIQPLFEHKVPTWSARGSKLVARGALLSVARENFDFIAPFYAAVVARIFNGVKPRDIPQVFKDKMRLAINLETAKTIGYPVPPNILKEADIVYDKIEVPQGTP